MLEKYVENRREEVFESLKIFWKRLWCELHEMVNFVFETQKCCLVFLSLLLYIFMLIYHCFHKVSIKADCQSFKPIVSLPGKFLSMSCNKLFMKRKHDVFCCNIDSCLENLQKFKLNREVWIKWYGPHIKQSNNKLIVGLILQTISSLFLCNTDSCRKT